MPIRPIKLLNVEVTNITPVEDWLFDDLTGDPWIGLPYRWEVNLNVNSQFHSDHTTLTPNFYNGLDIVVNDWLIFNNYMAVKIISISSQTDINITCIVEDIDRWNIFSNPLQSGEGIGPISPSGIADAFILELAEDGLPIWTNIVPFSIPVTLQQEVNSRFRARNLVENYIRVNQPGHTFNIGDFIFMNSSGVYELSQASSVNVEKTVGKVNSINIPGLDWFTYEPIGEYKENINPPLPGGNGELIYISTTGTLTNVKPFSYAYPVYIQLNNTGTKGIYLKQGVITTSNVDRDDVYIISGLVSNITSGTYTINNFFTYTPISLSEIVLINGLQIKAYSISGTDLIIDVDDLGYYLENGDIITAEYRS